VHRHFYARTYPCANLVCSQVVWAKAWWTQTAQLVDEAIASELETRNTMQASIVSEQGMALQVKKVSAALNALMQQHKPSQDAARAQLAQKKIKWLEAEARRQKRQNARDRAAALKAASNDAALLGRLQVALASYEQGGSPATLLDNVHGINIAPYTKRLLMGPKFNFVHDVVLQLLAATQYLPDFFSLDETNRRSV
jgi:hypothetical protein